MSAEIAVLKQQGRPFAKGRSGNPAAKPKGVRNRATIALEVLLDGEAEPLTRKVVEMPLAGDLLALKLCLERYPQHGGLRGSASLTARSFFGGMIRASVTLLRRVNLARSASDRQNLDFVTSF